MAHQYYNGENHHNRRTNQQQQPIPQDNYEYEIMKAMERERQFNAAQQQIQRENVVMKSQQSSYGPTTVKEMYTSVQQAPPPPPPATPQTNRRVMPIQLSPIKPLRIIIIRHAERADAVLGSDWSKKSFDRAGRYIRFSEHLPDALPSRSYLHHYVIDVPLTNRGRMHAF